MPNQHKNETAARKTMVGPMAFGPYAKFYLQIHLQMR